MDLKSRAELAELAWGCFESLNIVYKIQPVVVLSIYDNINSTR